jgi:hypothetical protein
MQSKKSSEDILPKYYYLIYCDCLSCLLCMYATCIEYIGVGWGLLLSGQWLTDDDSSTLSKISVCGSDYMEKMQRDLPLESIPVMFGGEFQSYNEPFDFAIQPGGALWYKGAPTVEAGAVLAVAPTEAAFAAKAMCSSVFTQPSPTEYRERSRSREYYVAAHIPVPDNDASTDTGTGTGTMDTAALNEGGSGDFPDVSALDISVEGTVFASPAKSPRHVNSSST